MNLTFGIFPSGGVDWSSFWPDVLVGALTGLTVGLVLVLFESVRTSNGQAAEDTRLWSRQLSSWARAVENGVPLDRSGFAVDPVVVANAARWLEKIDTTARPTFREIPGLRIVGDLFEGIATLDKIGKGLEAELRSALSGLNETAEASFITLSDVSGNIRAHKASENGAWLSECKPNVRSILEADQGVAEQVSSYQVIWAWSSWLSEEVGLLAGAMHYGGWLGSLELARHRRMLRFWDRKARSKRREPMLAAAEAALRRYERARQSRDGWADAQSAA